MCIRDSKTGDEGSNIFSVEEVCHDYVKINIKQVTGEVVVGVYVRINIKQVSGEAVYQWWKLGFM